MRADLTKLYLFSESFERDAVRAEFTCDTKPIDQWLSGICTSGITLRQFEGKKYFHFIRTTLSVGSLISKSVQIKLKNSGVSGWRICPVEFCNKCGDLVDGYDMLSIVGRCGEIDKGRSKISKRKAISGDGDIDVSVGYYFCEESWDGSDFFRPDGTRMIMCTEKAKTIVESFENSNINFDQF